MINFWDIIPFYRLKIQVSEILFHLPRAMFDYWRLHLPIPVTLHESDVPGRSEPASKRRVVTAPRPQRLFGFFQTQRISLVVI